MSSLCVERDEDTTTGITPFVVGCVLAVLIERSYGREVSVAEETFVVLTIIVEVWA